ncbi:MAG: terminase large subunit domain-containing protein [Candidatus Avelusimicrobium sp.]|uniref:terminase large subunit domain-containing protein n=1 Tax=Candidatus Avelusimicrobium sp. TaxID=3048833 RepID=UPI003F0325CD
MKSSSVVIPYHPRPAQAQIHPQLETHRFCVLVTHRQLGKTVCAVNHLLKKALQNTKSHPRYFYIAPLLKQAKMIAWDYLKRFSAPLPGVSVHESELCVRLPGGARIWVTGADNPDALRGTYADGVVLDEYAQIKPDVFTEIVRPMLLSREGWAVFMGTPKGQNAFYELFNRARKAAQTEPGVWWVGVFRADESGVIAPAELERLRRETPSHVFRQEYLCDFTASAENILIPIDQVSAACTRRYASGELGGAPKIIGVDPARFGDDRSVIFMRRGLQAYPPLVFAKMDNMALAAAVAGQIESFRPDAVFIDAGCGGGVIDRLRQLGFSVTEVPFGGAPSRPGQYANKRAEMWGEMALWITAGGALPDDGALKADLCQVCYDYDAVGRLRLEPKEKIKERCGKSPDLADALALTFASPVRPRALGGRGEFARSDYEVI